MTELNPPWALQPLATHTANVNRGFMNLLAGGAEGILPSSGLGTMAVVQRGAGANMSIDVGAGVCAVFGDENNVQGLYCCVNDSTVNKTIAAADPTNPRRDLVVVRVRDAFYSGATNAWDLFVVTGTPAASPADPAVPNNCVTLARVAVAAAASSITNANITDLRPFAPIGILPANSGRRPGVQYGAFSQEPSFKSTPVNGLYIHEQDTGALLFYDGANWKRTGDQIPHEIATRRLITVSQSITNQTSYVVTPNATDRTALQTAFTKYRADTKLVLTFLASFYMSSGSAQNMYAGLTPNGGTTNWDVASFFMNTTAQHYDMVGTATITGFAAGSYTVEPVWKSAAAAVINWDAGNNHVTFSVRETL